MAKKFIKVTGLNKVFDVSTDGKTLDTTKLKTSISETATDYSILYMVATSDDEQYGYKAGTTYTWSRGILVSSNIDSANTWREVKVNGASKIAANNSQALDVSAGKNVTLSYTNNKVVITATNTDEKTTESGHYTPSTKKTSYGDSYADTETVITKIDVDSKGHIVGANEEINDPIIGGENILRCTQYPIVTVANIDNSWIHGKFVMSNISLDLYGHLYETTRIESPASTNREYCDAIILKDNAQYGVCQTVSNIYLDNLISHIERSLINLDNTLINGHTVKSIPFTFSFYAKMQDKNTETSITYTPIIAQNDEILKQASETASLIYSDGWKKFSITRHVDIETIKESLLGLGYVGNETTTAVLIACPSLTIGKYDIDWKPNPLDAKSDIVGVGNILRCSAFTTDEYQNYYVNITDINVEDIVSSVYSTPQQLPGCESLDNIYALAIGLSSNTYGISYREPGALFGNNSGWHTALMNYVGNTDTEIPVSMSIWCYSTANIEVALMPVSFKGYDLFAPLTYVSVPGRQWTRLTRTIYVPAGITSSGVYLGSALATCSGNADVLFALPMVTLGSIPSTWFPSAWDLMNNTSCIDSTARINAANAQTTANSALSTANTANTNASNALSSANSAYTLANNASTAAKNAQTTADGKVSKSGDTMSGDLNMGGKNINNVNSLSTDNLYGTTDSTITIEADIVNMKSVLDMKSNEIDNVYKITSSDPSSGIIIDGGIDTSKSGFYVNGTAGTSSQLMQGDGKFRAIGNSSSTAIPTWGDVAYATGVNWNSVSIRATTTFSLPNTRSSYHFYGSNTLTAVTLNIYPVISQLYNFHYFTINQSTNTCTVTLASSYTIKTKGNVTSFTVAAGQSIEFCAAMYAGYIYVTYTIFG